MANACADLLAAPHIEPRVFFAQRPAHVFCRLWAGRSPGVGRRWRCVLIGPAGERGPLPASFDAAVHDVYDRLIGADVHDRW